MKIKELFSSADKWTKEMMARTAEGKWNPVHDSDTTCWSLTGGVMKCYEREGRSDEIYALIKTEVLSRGFKSVSSFNEAASFEDIKQLVEKLDI